MRVEDAVDIYEIINSQRDYLEKWLPFVADTTSIATIDHFIDSVINQPKGKIEPTFTIRKDGKIIGLIGFKATDSDNLRTEIGYWLSESFQGEEIMTRSVHKLCQYAFTELGIHRVQLKCAIGNSPSSNIAKRLGFGFVR